MLNDYSYIFLFTSECGIELDCPKNYKCIGFVCQCAYAYKLTSNGKVCEDPGEYHLPSSFEFQTF